MSSKTGTGWLDAWLHSLSSSGVDSCIQVCVGDLCFTAVKLGLQCLWMSLKTQTEMLEKLSCWLSLNIIIKRLCGIAFVSGLCKSLLEQVWGVAQGLEQLTRRIIIFPQPTYVQHRTTPALFLTSSSLCVEWDVCAEIVDAGNRYFQEASQDYSLQRVEKLRWVPPQGPTSITLLRESLYGITLLLLCSILVHDTMTQ